MLAGWHHGGAASRVGAHGGKLPRDAGAARATIERIDESHPNAKQRWLEMGSPEYLREADVDELHAASMLRPEPYQPLCDDGAIHVAVDLPSNGVAAVTLHLEGAPARARRG
jgi:beta-xylosidase